MVIHPIRIFPKRYRGKDEHKRLLNQKEHRNAQKLEKTVNEEFLQYLERGESTHVFNYYELEDLTGIPLKTVQRIMFPVDCGSNGITICKPGYDPAKELEKEIKWVEEDVRQFKQKAKDQSEN